MSDTVNFAELDGQHVELLAARTVLSVFAQIPVGDATTSGGSSSQGMSLPSMLNLTGSTGSPGTNADGAAGESS